MLKASEQTIPTYLNADYITKAIAKAAGRKVELLDCSIALASQNGENFCSCIYRVHAKFKFETEGELLERYLIVKDMIPEIAAIGSNERLMYERLLPKMESLLTLETRKPAKLKPDCLLSEHTEREMYVLEDLGALGFREADRWLGLDIEHARVAFRKIAQFHAVSIIHSKNNPDDMAQLEPSHFAKGADDPIARSIAIGGINYVADLVEQWEGFVDIAKKVRNTATIFDERIKRIVNPKRHWARVNVINHGDLWVNNFLYNYDGELPQDIVFVDFQNCFEGSPGFDLNYLLYTSLELGVLQQNRVELLHLYYESFREILSASSVVPKQDIPSWEDILHEVEHCEFVGYYAAIAELPICCMTREVSKNFTVDTFSDMEAMTVKRKLLYSNESVLSTLRYALKYFDNQGVLD